jgi:hypothetical protein
MEREQTFLQFNMVNFLHESNFYLLMHYKLKHSELPLYSNSGEGKRFVSLHGVQIGSLTQSASHPVGTGHIFLGGVKRPELEPEYLAPSNAKLKNGGPILPLSHTSSWHGA